MEPNWRHRYISRFDSVTDTRPRAYLLSTIFKEIQQGNATLANLAEDTPYRTLAEVTERARELRFKHNNLAAYNLLKESMPQFTPAAVLKTRSDVKAFSHLACLEWDGDVDSDHALVIGKQHPNVLAIWRSLSGNPKFLVPITPVSKDGDELTTENFKHAWYSVAYRFEEIGDADTTAMRPTQPQALCFDPDIYVNWDALPVEWDIDDDAFKEAFPKLSATENLAYSELPVEYHIAIETMEWKADGWGETSVPCPWHSHEHDAWGGTSNGTGIRKNNDNDYTFHCFKCPDSKRYSQPPPIKPLTRQHIDELIAKAPPIEVNERPSFPYFTTEEKQVVEDVLGLSADAGWNGQTPVFTTRYEYLHPLTNKFALNGQPSEVEKRRVWTTVLGKCDVCGGVTARWVDRYLLTAGYYCDGCHKDYPLGSYLELELGRKLPNSIVSDHQGYLGDDPEFEDFRLWAPGMFSHLGAGMATGKSTEISKAIEALALQNLGRGIIATPRISLTRFLAHQLRKLHGRQAWGMWHEGSGRSEQYIGSYGAVVCLPSLARAVAKAYVNGLTASDLYVAIDEMDFGYSLLSLAVHQATAVKKCLLDIFLATGLVVSGQTEFTLALEAFAAELGCENLQGFYNIAPPADGIVELRKYPDVKGKNALTLAGSIESIEVALRDGYNVYVFCASRRDGDVIAERFAEHVPVVYNSYTKGNPRCDAVLKNQRLPEGSRLFIGTSAAGVGISILDPKARTVRVGGLTYGSRDASMGVQTTLRDRGRRGIEWHFADYNFALPTRPRETERVSLYHEEIKQRENQYAHLSENAVKKVARSLALSTLADHQLETFVHHHLGNVGNMQVVETQSLLPDESEVEWVTVQRRDAIKQERALKCKMAVNILANRDFLTRREIRVKSYQNDFTQIEQIAHEYANGLASAVGWNDADGPLEVKDIDVAVQLAEHNVQPEKLDKRRSGYFAVHYPKWVSAVFAAELEAASSDTVNAGSGRELTAVRDDRFLGEVLTVLLNRLKDEVFESDVSLANAIHEVLDTVSNGQTLFGRIKQGGLGAQAYRRSRFLKTADDAYVINWARNFIKEYYPATLSKRKNTYSLVHDKKIELYLNSFKCWLSQRIDGEVPELDYGFDAIVPQTEKRERARELRKSGATLQTIMTVLDESYGTVQGWCKDIKVEKDTREQRARRNRKEKTARRQKVIEMHDAGIKPSEISKQLNVSRSTVLRWIKK